MHGKRSKISVGNTAIKIASYQPLIASIMFLGISLQLFYTSGSGEQWGSFFIPISL